MDSMQQIYQSSQTNPTSQSGDDQSTATDAVKKELGKDEFLNLLMTQLKNQNPLEPMDNKDFMSQMAQFSSLEQMNNLNSTMGDYLKFQKISQAGSLVGKKVEVLNSDTGAAIMGTIEKANVSGEETKITVDGVEYPMSNIQQVLAEG